MTVKLLFQLGLILVLYSLTTPCAFAADDPCYNYEHEDYGMIGSCIPSVNCTSGGGESISGICPSFSEDYTCCFNENFPGREMRGIWIATVSNIDWPDSPTQSVAQHQESLAKMIDNIELAGFNAIYFQVRPCGDSLYISDIEPFSKYLTGRQGEAPSPLWDPLQFVIDYAHERNIEVHAWINPYRASMSPTTEDLAPNHMAKLYPQYAYPYSTYLWMDPGVPEVQNQTSKVVQDIVTRYDVDGLHMDDYFYPYPVEGIEFADSDTYAKYVQSGGSLGLDDWRRENVNTLIRRLNTEIHEIKSWVKFSVSPFGIYRACQEGGMPCSIAGFDQYAEIYCDAKLWFEMGWVDVLIPQLYWRIDPPLQSYPVLLDWWVDQNIEHRHFFAGNYLSRVDIQDWPFSEIRDQVLISREKLNRGRGSWGNVMFSAYIIGDDFGGIIQYFRDNIYQFPALQPPVTWLAKNKKPEQPSLLKHGNKLSWTKSGNFTKIVIYKKDEKQWNLVHIVEANKEISEELKIGIYAVSAIDRFSQESTRQLIQI